MSLLSWIVIWVVFKVETSTVSLKLIDSIPASISRLNEIKVGLTPSGVKLDIGKIV